MDIVAIMGSKDFRIYAVESMNYISFVEVGKKKFLILLVCIPVQFIMHKIPKFLGR